MTESQHGSARADCWGRKRRWLVREDSLAQRATVPGLPPVCPEPQSLVTEDCIQPHCAGPTAGEITASMARLCKKPNQECEGTL
jgi:hypothetical protein